MHSKCVIAGFLILGMITCVAQTRREQKSLCDQQETKRVEITDSDATILEFAIGHVSLKDIQAKLGSAKIERVSREGESDTAMCYVSPVDGTVLVFYSGPMGGWKDMTWFAIWSREAAYPNPSQCASSTLISRSLATASGLRLGLTKNELEGIAGRPTKVGSASAKYEYLCRRKMSVKEIQGFKDVNNWDVTSDPYFDRMSWIDVRYANSAASRLEIGRIESY
jgi:hypothetical protein